MTSANSFLAGMAATAAAMRGAVPLGAVKTADTPYIANESMTQDPELAVSLEAGATYLVFGWVVITGASPGGGGLQAAFGYPTGSSGYFTGWGLATSGTAANVNSARAFTGTSTAAFGTNGTTPAPAMLMGVITVPPSGGGDLSLWFCQVTSNATSTVVKAGSALVALQIE